MDDSFWEEIERSRRMTPEQRFLGTLDMIDFVHELRIAGIRREFPNASSSELVAALRARIQVAERSDAVR